MLTLSGHSYGASPAPALGMAEEKACLSQGPLHFATGLCFLCRPLSDGCRWGSCEGAGRTDTPGGGECQCAWGHSHGSAPSCLHHWSLGTERECTARSRATAASPRPEPVSKAETRSAEVGTPCAPTRAPHSAHTPQAHLRPTQAAVSLWKPRPGSAC